ncbi:MAG: indolepyruvate ferredoxin oxidoreductase subunit alpha [Candidatus Latescibacteria bacterium]|nr:indolepyruvate ferredoxin oxidoreductase subunit alpha [Candidatus Latescibacterota bacterium]
MSIARKLMTGDEAVARGAWEAGVKVAAAYPGTPSTEILENIALYDEIYAEWSPNEKVALEVAGNAAIAGVRAIASMKHVGLNVAADPFMTLAYTGIGRGLVVACADDPGMHSSQNEQDNRYYAKLAKVPMLEPSNSQEALDMTKEAFKISEDYDTPVLIVLTTRVCHGKNPVTLSDREEVETKEFIRNTAKYVMVPGHARKRHVIVEERAEKLKELSEKSIYNRIIKGNGKIGIISSGVASQYAMEVMPDADFLLLGMTYPLPEKLIGKFANSVEKLYVVEELEPYLEEQIKAFGIEVIGKDVFPRCGELNPELIRNGLTGTEISATRIPEDVFIPSRPPVLCPGCPHRGFFHIVNKNKLFVTGDIGCYTLSVLPPLTSMDTCICMGASISGAIGFAKAFEGQPGKKVVAVLGDSTFMHSGLTGLMDTVYNKANVITCVLDNRTTAMTGHQEHPGTGFTVKGEPTHSVDIAAVAKALGVKYVYEVDPYNLDETNKAVKACLKINAPSVIVAKRACALKCRNQDFALSVIDQAECKKCGACLKIGCPAIIKKGDVIMVDKGMCYGCGICRQVCPFGAINAVE